MIKKIPLPIAGLILAIATMGNMFSYFGSGLRYTLGIVAGILYILLICKIVTNFNLVKEDLNNPVILTVIGTFDMALMVFATYLASSIMPIAKILWIIGIILHIILMISVAVKYILNFDIKKMFASFFVAFVGIVVASVTAPVFKYGQIGQVIFYVGFVLYIVLIPIIFYKVFKIKNIPEALLPTNIIIAAPASLCLAGYVNSFGEKANPYFILIFGIFAVLMTIIGLLFVPKVLFNKFFPSFSSLTFPFVISALAMRLSSLFLLKNESFKIAGTLFGYVYNIEAVLAVIFVAFVLVKYLMFIFQPLKKSVVS